MVKIGWLSDTLRVHGGAEISDNAFIDGRPTGVEIVHCPPQKRPPDDIDIFVVNNCVTYDAKWIECLERVPVVKHCHDLWPYGDPILRRWILEHAAEIIFNSLKQLSLFNYSFKAEPRFVHPSVDVARIRRAVSDFKGEREGILFLGRIEAGKGVQYAIDWSIANDERIDFYGQANDRMMLSQIVKPSRYCGEVAPDDVPALLARYKMFFYVPMLDDLCGRTMVEASAAGMEIEAIGDADAFHDWLDLDACQNAPADFWRIVLDTTK